MMLKEEKSRRLDLAQRRFKYGESGDWEAGGKQWQAVEVNGGAQLRLVGFCLGCVGESAGLAGELRRAITNQGGRPVIHAANQD